MNKAKDSLTANLEDILANLPAEFQADAKKEVEDMPAVAEAAMSAEAQVSAIKAALVANENVDESAAAAELTNIQATEVAVKATEAEIEKEIAELLTQDHTKAS